ncbi:GtrA family protein [Enterococcus sp. HY326]|uniref:GtrA family protein n=1 Tax=Enterococcus sp. HY326 TaxID=2971265 RepID=UPI0022400620|nr:GtrA family protein [Enterococcus sp. HY326]
MTAILLIPIYQPTAKTLAFMQELSQQIAPIIVVDDGSGPDYQAAFQEIESLGAEVLTYPDNLGKGHALKAGFKFIQENYPNRSVVTADGDGQHTISDISQMLQRTESLREQQFLLGVRSFSKATTPTRSLFGNRMTSLIYYLSSGIRLEDTQTGLRGFPSASLPDLLLIKGQRFEYEMNQLLELPQADYQIETLPIATVYEEKNHLSHFRTIQDSFLVYRPLVAFLLSSLSSALVDVTLFVLIAAIFGQQAQMLLVATVTARILSGIFNYQVNRKLVFQNKTNIKQSFWKYSLLFGSQLLLSWLGVTLLSSVIQSILISKLVIDFILFFFSFSIQKRVVFTPR